MSSKTFLGIVVPLCGAVMVYAMWGLTIEEQSLTVGAPSQSARIERNIIPETDSRYTLGTTSKAWLNIFTDELCLNGDCKTAWPGGSSAFATTSADYWIDQYNKGYFFSTTSVNYWETTQAARGSSGGGGNVATSSAETSTYVPFWTSTGATPATLSGGVSAFAFNSAASRLTITYASSTAISATTLYGALSGNASTATALAANGSNCSSGSAPLGVDASGAAEGCFDVWTEAENTAAGYTNNTGTVTSVGLSAPTGFSVSGSPVTTSGTLALAFASGYSLPLTATTTDLVSFRDTPSTRITAGTGLSWSGNTLNAQVQTSDLHDAVTLAGSLDYLTITGQQITRGAIDLATDVTGLLPNGNLANSTISGISLGSNLNALTAGDGLTSAGTYTGATARTFAIDFTRANTWTGLQSFSNATSTLFSATTGWIGTLNLTNALTVANGGTGASTLTGLLQGNGTGAITGGATINNDNWSGTDLSVANGGTGVSTLTGVALGNGTSAFTAASAQTCTNQFVRAMSAAYVATCATVDISSDTNLAVTAPVVLTGDTLSLGDVKQYPAFRYATSTAWTGTTTIALAPAFVAETWNSVKCFTNVGTLNVRFHDGTNRMNLLNASTTVGTYSFDTNNTFTAGETRYVEIGTPATAPTEISCSVSITRSIN